MFCPSADGRVRNTLRAVGPGVDAFYDKIHLFFDAFGFVESQTAAPGSEPVIISIGGVQVGLTTCYDVRFPGLYTRLADLGAQVICLAASWGAGPGKVDQWKLLSRARALESTSDPVAAGKAHPGLVCAVWKSVWPTGIGHCEAISPDRVTRGLQRGPEPGTPLGDCAIEMIGQARATIPVLANRRF